MKRSQLTPAHRFGCTSTQLASRKFVRKSFLRKMATRPLKANSDPHIQPRNQPRNPEQFPLLPTRHPQNSNLPQRSKFHFDQPPSKQADILTVAIPNPSHQLTTE